MHTELECRCEANTQKGQICQSCMGRTCHNTTYYKNGEVFHLLDATILWTLGNYDGPMIGIAVHKGLACYFKCYTYYRGRSYWLYPLRSLEWDQELISRAVYISKKHFIDKPEINRSKYIDRKPLGFFRLNNENDRWMQNSICEHYMDKYHEDKFQDWAN